jgi:hypothetical protein
MTDSRRPDTSEKTLDALLSELHFQGSLREDANKPDADASKAFAAAWVTLRVLAAERDRLRDLLRRADEELRLIRMKDTGALYDIGLRAALSAALKDAPHD